MVPRLVWRGDDRCDPIGDGRLGHRQRIGERGRSVVQTGQHVAVDIDEGFGLVHSVSHSLSTGNAVLVFRANSQLGVEPAFEGLAEPWFDALIAGPSLSAPFQVRLGLGKYFLL